MSRFTGSARFAERLRAAAAATPSIAADDPALVQIIDWLSRLIRLEGVPFSYVVPDPQMLPPESIRFFQVDDNWITSLIDGAFSIGRATTNSTGKEAALLAHVKSAAHATLHHHRAKRVARAPQITPTGFSGVMSGFVLRSDALSIWPGLEAKGYLDPGMSKPATLLRFDMLAPGLALGLFSGIVAQLTFAQPAETLHFGVDLPDHPNDSYTKALRYADDKESQPAGQPLLDGGQPVIASVSFRTRAAPGVVDVAGLAGTIQSRLLAKHGMSSGTDYTAAQFALELVEGVQQVLFTIDYPEGSTGAAS